MITSLASVASASPLGDFEPRKPQPEPYRFVEDPMSTCELREAIGSGVAMIAYCGDIRRCIHGDCLAAMETARVPYVCIDHPVLLIEQQRLDGGHQWGWYPLLSEVLEKEIEATLRWGRAVDDEVRDATRIDELLGQLDEPTSNPAPSACLAAWAERHVMEAIVLIAFEGTAAEREATWTTLRAWFTADANESVRQRLLERLYIRARQSEPPPEFAAFARALVAAAAHDWAELREQGYGEREQFAARYARDLRRLDVANELSHSSSIRDQHEFAEAEHGLCREWLAAHEAGVLEPRPACASEHPPAIRGGCTIAGSPRCPIGLLILLLAATVRISSAAEPRTDRSAAARPRSRPPRRSPDPRP